MEHDMNTLRTFLLSTTLATLAATASAGESPVYDNLSATGGYHGSDGYIITSTEDYAAPFVPTSDHLFDSVDLGLADVVFGSSATVRLYADAGGVPGTLIEDLGNVGNLPLVTSSTINELTTATSNDRPVLLAGTTYWIRCQKGDGIPLWGRNITFETGYASKTGGAPWKVETGQRPAMRVWGTPLVSTEVYGNLAPSGTHQIGPSWSVTGANGLGGSVSRAASFVLAQDARLDSLQLPVLNALVGGTDDVRIELRDDASGAPGGLIEDLGVHSGFPQYGITTSGQSTFPSVAKPTLLAGTTYWIVCSAAHADTWVRWAPNDKGAQGQIGTSSAGSWTVQNGTELALQVDGLSGMGPVASYCTAGVSASGCQATLSAAGMPCASAGSGFVVTASNVEGAKDGVFFYGANGRQANSWGNGSSYQCVVPPVKRGGLLDGTGTTGLCDGSFSQDLTALWSANPPKNPGGGAVVQAQLWYRDPFNTSNQTTSLSDAIEFTVSP
jgi:hypothetical protein